MSDNQLHESYCTLKVALKEVGNKEKIMSAFADCSTEIARRYFDSKGITDTKFRKEFVENMI